MLDMYLSLIHISGRKGHRGDQPRNWFHRYNPSLWKRQAGTYTGESVEGDRTCVCYS